MSGFIAILVLIATFTSPSVAQGCIPRSYGRSSFVCVCNATYCDNAPGIGNLLNGEAVLVTSNEADSRFQTTNLRFGVPPTDTPTDEIRIDASKKYQSILGFGGAFTDATGINIARLSAAAQQQLIGTYYGTNGIEYNIGRVPIAGTDFSTYTYSYDDFPGDITLSNFSLTIEDTVYKIPYINMAKSMAGSKPIRLFASPWSAPAWMKSNNEFYGQGYLLLEYYQVWADYFVRFFEEYKNFGLDFWGVTAQNEPNDGRVPGFPFNCMGWDAQNQSDFVGNNLGPTLEAKGFGNVKIMIMDDQRRYLLDWVTTVLNNPLANKYVAGAAVHWYGNLFAPPSVLTDTHNLYPDRFILATEACEGTTPKPVILLGAWQRLESYALDIIENLNNFVIGWVDWNLALDEEGGPNWSNNFVDSPIIVNNTIDEFYKQPMFYAMGHFSKYIPENSVRIDIQLSLTSSTPLVATAFQRPDGKRTIVVLNQSDEDKVVAVNDVDRGTVYFNCSARSIQTLVYQ